MFLVHIFSSRSSWCQSLILLCYGKDSGKNQINESFIHFRGRKPISERERERDELLILHRGVNFIALEHGILHDLTAAIYFSLLMWDMGRTFPDLVVDWPRGSLVCLMMTVLILLTGIVYITEIQDFPRMGLFSNEREEALISVPWLWFKGLHVVSELVFSLDLPFPRKFKTQK